MVSWYRTRKAIKTLNMSVVPELWKTEARQPSQVLCQLRLKTNTHTHLKINSVTFQTLDFW